MCVCVRFWVVCMRVQRTRAHMICICQVQVIIQNKCRTVSGIWIYTLIFPVSHPQLKAGSASAFHQKQSTEGGVNKSQYNHILVLDFQNTGNIFVHIFTESKNFQCLESVTMTMRETCLTLSHPIGTRGLRETEPVSTLRVCLLHTIRLHEGVTYQSINTCFHHHFF